MNDVLLDINIFLDYFLGRDGYDEARKIINYCFNGNIIGYISAHEVTTLSYFLEKGISERDKITEIISKILKTFTIIEINKKILGNALFSNIVDYEDAVIEASALEKRIDYIITKNTKDFKYSKVKAILPKSYLSLIDK